MTQLARYPAREQRHGSPDRSRGQSVVEFAIVAPLMVVLVVAIVDFARIYTTTLNVESAAREAADYGAFGSYQWKPDVRTHTEQEMLRRACVAVKDLPDYVGSDSACTNPTVALELVKPPTAPSCDIPTNDPPCSVKVTLKYAFRPLVPLNVELLGMQFGVPSTITFERSSEFPMSDLNAP